jgi:hypothetical protein
MATILTVKVSIWSPVKSVLKMNPTVYSIAEKVIQYPNDTANAVPISVSSTPVDICNNSDGTSVPVRSAGDPTTRNPGPTPTCFP